MARLSFRDLPAAYRRQAIAQHGPDVFNRRRPHKYSAKPTTIDGVRYASRTEGVRAVELELLRKGREIKVWKRQVPFCLGSEDNVCIVDFVVTDRGGEQWAEDVKGYETAAFKRHKRLWRKYGPMPLHTLKRSGNGWRREVITPRPGTISKDGDSWHQRQTVLLGGGGGGKTCG